jgi:glycosyltransferase involved in cell wall biosynthesis
MSRTVVFIIPNLNSGGAERAALNLAAAAPRSSCSVIAEWSGGDLAGEPLAESVRVLTADTDPPPRLERFRRLAGVLRRQRPDVVIAMLSPVVATAAARAASIPVVHWLQSPWSHTTRATAKTARGLLHRAVLRWVGRNSAMILGATPGLVDECLALGVPVNKLALLPNGIDVEPLPTNTHRSPAQPALIVTVGRLEPQKRHDLLLHAVAELSRTRKVEVLIIGTGRDGEELRQLSRQLGLEGIVRFLGFVPRPADYLNDADCFVLATDHEGFGNAIVEALACGVPAVVSDVEPDSVASLADGIASILDQRPFPADLRARARKRARTFRTDRVAERFENLLDSALSARA